MLITPIAASSAPATIAYPSIQAAQMAVLEPIVPTNVHRITMLSTLQGEYSAAFLPDGTRVMTEMFSHIWWWDVQTGEQVATWENETSVKNLLLNPDGTRLAVINDDTIGIWDTKAGKPLRMLTGHTDTVNGVAFSSDGTRLASASNDRTIRLWDVETGIQQTTINTENMILSVAFSPDGKTLASGAWGDYVKLWDVQTGKELSFRGQGNVQSLAFSPDGKHLAAAGDTVTLWDVQTGASLAELRGESVAFSPDGSILATTSDDLVWLWDAETGEALATLIGHSSGGVWKASFSPDGKYLASIGWHIVQLWGIPTVDESVVVERSGVILKASGDMAMPFVALVPEKWLVSSDQSPRYELQIVSIATNIQTCFYTVSSLTRRRIDVKAAVIDLEAGKQIASQDFLGSEPGPCNQTETLSLTGGNHRDGQPPPTDAFEAWLRETMSAIGMK
jgi:dipeptidyl aminopeptidase/acylaminoacyl peptidase